MSDQGVTDRLGLLLASGAAFGFAFKAILVKLAYPYGVDAVALLALRMLLSLPFYVVVGLRPRPDAAPWTRQDAWKVGALGLVGYYGASLFDFQGLQYVSAGLERLVLFTYPTLTVLLGVVLLGRGWTWRQALGLGLTWVGIGAAVAHDMRAAGTVADTLQGLGLVLLSAVCYAGYLLGAAPMIARLGSRRFTASVMLVSTAAVLVHHGLTAPLGDLLQPAPVWGLALAMALFSTVLPTFMLSAAIQRIGSERAATVGSLGPILTIGLGALLLGEPLSWVQGVGAALVLGGVTLASRPSGVVPAQGSPPLR
ncbi:MAG: DMT family transporter [Alphaproteobacteria bacterium]|nr:DMT family transporter [Alphaproteobacteria bacterium]